MVGGLELGRWNVAAGRVEALVVPPGHPRRGRELDLVGRPPRPWAPDALCLVEAVDRLGEGGVVAVLPGQSGIRASAGSGCLPSCGAGGAPVLESTETFFVHSH